MHVEMRPIESIRPYENNPRINDAAVDAVAASIREFGWRQPIVVDEQDVIIVGHTRYKAALKLGLTEVPVHVAVGLSPGPGQGVPHRGQPDGRHVGWDDDKLPLELAALQELGFDLDLTGFSGDELLRLLGSETNEGQTDPDDVPEPPDEADHATRRPVAARQASPALRRLQQAGGRGPLAERGGHSFSQYRSAVQRAGRAAEQQRHRRRPQLVRGLRQQHPGRDVARCPEKAEPTTRKLRAKDRPLANDFVSEEEFDRLLHAWFGNLARVLSPGRGFYIWGGYANVGNYPPVLKAVGLYFSQAVIWIKEHPVLTRKDFMGNHEWGFYGWREGAAHQFYGPNNATDVWSIKKVNPQSMIHLTEKPVELAARAMEYSSKPGEHVLDLFGGSGSTLIAAEQAGRKAYLMELDPLYCDVIVSRYEQFTGKKAARVGGAA